MAHASTTGVPNFLKDAEGILKAAKNDSDLFDAIVNTPFADKTTAPLLGLGIIVFLLVNKKTKTIDRIALSRTEPAKGAVKMSPKPFRAIKIPANYPDNIIVKAIKTGQFQATTDWQYLFTPDLTPAQARFNQAGAGIACSVVYPLQARDGGALIFSYFAYPEQIDDEQHGFMREYANLVSRSLSR